MASTTLLRGKTEFVSDVPQFGTFPAAANQLLPEGTIAQLDASERVISPGSADTSGLRAIGVVRHTINNLTGSDLGGGAGAKDVEIKYGVHGPFAISGTTPEAGDRLYVVDNQTLSVDPTGPRGFAGTAIEVRNGGVYCWFGPHQLAEDVSAAVDALEVDALSAQKMVHVPLGNFFVYSTGAAIIPFNDGVADGIDPTAESIGYKFNVASTAKIAASVPLPNDLDDAAAVVVHVLGFRVGASDVTAALTVGAFFRVPGAAFSADADAGGDTDAFAAATTVVSEVTRSIAAGDVPAAPASLLLTLVPTAALDADDLVVTEVWLEYTGKLLTS